MMNCKDFERTWNECLDDRGRGADASARMKAVDDHASLCPQCASVHSRYLVLSQGLRALARLPVVSPGFAERVLAAHAEPETVVIGGIAPFHRILATLTAAAVFLVAVTLGFRSREGGHEEPRNDVVQIEREVIPPVALTDALAVASSTTLAFAREASAPAARVGYELASAELSDSVPSGSLEFSVDVAPATRALQRVGDRLNAGVRPLEGSARHAFGFLIGPDAGRAKPATPSPRGA